MPETKESKSYLKPTIDFALQIKEKQSAKSTWTAPHLLDSMIYYLTSGVFCYAKRSTKQTIYARIQKTGDWNHAGRKIELQRNLS